MIGQALQGTITKKIIITNIFVFLVFNILLISEKNFYLFGLVPDLFWSGALWQPLTSIFLHGGLLHIAFNMFALYSLGIMVEHQLGASNYLKLYLGAGLIGSLFVILFQGNTKVPTIGASGAVTGILGALAVLNPNSMLMILFFPMRARTAAVLIGAISFIFGFFAAESGISHLGHLGGLIGGVLLARYFFTHRRSHSTPIEDDFEVRDNGFNLNEFFRAAKDRFEQSETIKPKEKVLVYDPRTGKYYYELK